MAYLKLEVPLVAQPSSDTCWHASAEMIWYYWQGKTGRQGPMNTLAKRYSANEPITEWGALGRIVGLMPVPRQQQYNSLILRTLLASHGPLWCAGNWYGFGHVVVLTGVDGDTVHINDPDGGVKKTGRMSWFNTSLFNAWDDCLQAKDPNRY
jgi:hypothetical protein